MEAVVAAAMDQWVIWISYTTELGLVALYQHLDQTQKDTASIIPAAISLSAEC